MSAELTKVAAILGGFLVLFALAELWRIRFEAPAEWTRKFVHVTIGIIVSSFHWIFASNLGVILLAVGMLGFMGVSRKLNWFPAIHGVQRRSYGDLYYILSTVFLFAISHSQPVLYFISMLTLTVSDALAALVGTSYQRLKYSVEHHYKSFEGSIIFFLSTFLIVEIPLLLLTDTDRLHCILVALQIAILATCLEAVCVNGLDNLLVPIGTYYLLYEFLRLPTSTVQHLLIWQLAILITTYLTAKRSQMMSVSGIIALQLFLFGAFNFGDPTWLIPALLALATLITFFLYFKMYIPQTNPKIYQVVATFYVTFVPSFLILAHFFSVRLSIFPDLLRGHDSFYVLYVGAVCSQLTIALYRFVEQFSDYQIRGFRLIFTLIILSILVIIPLSLFVQLETIRFSDLFFSLFIAVMGPVVYRLINYIKRDWMFPWDFRIQMLSTAIATLIILPVYVIYTLGL